MPPFDTRVYRTAEEIYTPSEKLIRAIFLNKGGMAEAKKRVKVNKRGTFYRYIPSKAYQDAIAKFHSH
jgi:hypothetical protein